MVDINEMKLKDVSEETLRNYLKGLEDKPLTLEEAKEKGYFVYSYDNGDYKYEDENGIQYLIRDGKEICKGSYVYSFDNGDYKYADENGIHYCRIDDYIWERKEKW